MNGQGRSGPDKVCRSKRHKLSILRRCSGAGEHAKRRQIRNVGSQFYRRLGSLGVYVAACYSRQKTEQMRCSADQDISTGPEECWTPQLEPTNKDLRRKQASGLRRLMRHQIKHVYADSL